MLISKADKIQHIKQTNKTKQNKKKMGNSMSGNNKKFREAHKEFYRVNGIPPNKRVASERKIVSDFNDTFLHANLEGKYDFLFF